MNVEDEIAALEQELMEAVRRRDILWREEWLRVTAGEYEIDSFAFEELEVLGYGEVVVVRSRYCQEGRMGGADRSGAYLMTDVWVRREGEWRLITRHSSPLGG